MCKSQQGFVDYENRKPTVMVWFIYSFLWLKSWNRMNAAKEKTITLKIIMGAILLKNAGGQLGVKPI